MALESANNIIEDSRQILVNELEASKRREATLLTERQSILNEKDALQNLLTQNLEETTNALVKDKDFLQTQLSKLGTEKGSLEDQLQQVQNENASANALMKELLEKISTLESTNNFSTETQNKMVSQLEEASKRESDLQAEKTKAENEKQSLEVLHKKALEDVEARLADNQQKAENENALLISKCESLEKEIANVSVEKTSLNDAVKNMQATQQINLDYINAKEIEIADVKSRLTLAEDNCLSLQAEKCAVLSEKESMEALLSQSAEEISKHLKSEQDKLKLELAQSIREKEILQTDLKTFNENKIALEEQLKLLSMKDEEIVKLKSEITSYHDSVSKVNKELQELRVNFCSLEENCNKLEGEKSESLKHISNLNSEHEKRLNDINETHINEIAKISSSLEDIKKENDALRLELLNVKLENSRVTENFKLKETSVLSSQNVLLDEKASLCQNLQKQLDLVTASENEAQKQLKQTQQNISDFKNDNERLLSELATLKEQMQFLLSTSASNDSSSSALKEENVRLKEKIKDLELQAANSVNSASISVSDTSSGIVIGENAEVQFLNSVIADLVTKNNELQLKNDIFMQGGVDTLGLVASLPKMPHPRIYCDICEEFDLHDTEDCPTQAGEDEPTSHSHFNGARHNERPYCDNCENFGHSTEDCEQETF